MRLTFYLYPNNALWLLNTNFQKKIQKQKNRLKNYFVLFVYQEREHSPHSPHDIQFNLYIYIYSFKFGRKHTHEHIDREKERWLEMGERKCVRRPK